MIFDSVQCWIVLFELVCFVHRPALCLFENFLTECLPSFSLDEQSSITVQSCNHTDVMIQMDLDYARQNENDDPFIVFELVYTNESGDLLKKTLEEGRYVSSLQETLSYKIINLNESIRQWTLLFCYHDGEYEKFRLKPVECSVGGENNVIQPSSSNPSSQMSTDLFSSVPSTLIPSSKALLSTAIQDEELKVSMSMVPNTQLATSSYFFINVSMTQHSTLTTMEILSKSQSSSISLSTDPTGLPKTSRSTDMMMTRVLTTDDASSKSTLATSYSLSENTIGNDPTRLTTTSTLVTRITSSNSTATSLPSIQLILILIICICVTVVIASFLITVCIVRFTKRQRETVIDDTEYMHDPRKEVVYSSSLSLSPSVTTTFSPLLWDFEMANDLFPITVLLDSSGDTNDVRLVTGEGVRLLGSSTAATDILPVVTPPQANGDITNFLETDVSNKKIHSMHGSTSHTHRTSFSTSTFASTSDSDTSNNTVNWAMTDSELSTWESDTSGQSTFSLRVSESSIQSRISESSMKSQIESSAKSHLSAKFHSHSESESSMKSNFRRQRRLKGNTDDFLTVPTPTSVHRESETEMDTDDSSGLPPNNAVYIVLDAS